MATGSRNKTIRIVDEERDALRRHLLVPESSISINDDFNGVVNCDIIDLLPSLPDGFADLIIIDPPYNLFRKFGNSTFNKMDSDDYEKYIRSWLPDVCRKLKDDGSLYLCGDWHCTSVLQRVLSESLTIINRITWQREKGRGASANWKNSMEDIWFAVKDTNNYHFNLEAVKVRRCVKAPYREEGKPKDWVEVGSMKFRDTCPGNFWDDIVVPFWSMPENTDHPTQKPEKLFAKLILASSEEGDIVFDPFCGSGTSAVVAKKLGRRYLVTDIFEDYCLTTIKRLQMADTDKSIQGYNNGVFWERNSTPQQIKETRKKKYKTRTEKNVK